MISANMKQNISSLNLSLDNYQALKSSGFTYLNEIPENVDFNKWKESVSAPPTKTALDIYHENNVSGTIYTFNKTFDDLLENEMLPGNIVEICGEPASGKSQICFQLCINVQLPKGIGGKEGSALYLCTNYNFSIERLKQLGEIIINKVSSAPFLNEKKAVFSRFNIDSILSNINHMQLSTYDEFLALIIHLKKWLKYNKIRLLIIDAITPIMQQIDYKERRQFIYSAFADLQRLAVEHEFAIIITNNITTRAKSINDIYKTPALGEAYYHRINSRIMLYKLKDNWCKALLEKSVIKSGCTAIFQL